MNTIPEEVITVGNTDNGNIITMRFKNAQASNLYGLFEVRQSVNGAPSYVVLAASRSTYGAESDNTNDFTFNITQDGYWKLIDTKLSLVYDGSTTPGTFYLGDGMLSIENNAVVLKTTSDDGVVDVVNTPGAEGYDSQTVFAAFNAAGNYYTFDENAGTTHTNALRENGTKVIATFNVVTTVDGNEFKSNVTDTGVFMQTHTHALGLTVTDFTGASVLESATWTVTRKGGTSKTYGGYTYDDDDQSAVINSNNDISNGTLNVSLTIAGEHVSDITYTVKGVTQTISNKELPIIAVSSTAPSVKITAISNDGNHNSKWGYTTSGNWIKSYTFKHQTVTSSISADGYSATIYAVSQVDNSLNKWARYTQPTLSITAYNVGECDSATLTLPKGDTGADIAYVFTAGGEKKMTLGSLSETWVGAHRCNYYIGHGKQEITEMILKKDGIEYTVKLDNKLTIDNPTLNKAYN